MQIDNETLHKLSSMNDEDLKKFIAKVAGESGLSAPRLSQIDVGRIRSILGDIQKGDPALLKTIDSVSQNIKKDGGNSRR
jgi:hypothetical protein